MYTYFCKCDVVKLHIIFSYKVYYINISLSLFLLVYKVCNAKAYIYIYMYDFICVHICLKHNDWKIYTWMNIWIYIYACNQWWHDSKTFWSHFTHRFASDVTVAARFQVHTPQRYHQSCCWLRCCQCLHSVVADVQSLSFFQWCLCRYYCDHADVNALSLLRTATDAAAAAATFSRDIPRTLGSRICSKWFGVTNKNLQPLVEIVEHDYHSLWYLIFCALSASFFQPFSKESKWIVCVANAVTSSKCLLKVSLCANVCFALCSFGFILLQPLVTTH